MTLRKFALDYQRDCTTDELREFYRQRTGLLRRKMGRSKCIRKLQQLDSEQTFRFLDLMPEIRNAIYDIALCHNSEKATVLKVQAKENLDDAAIEALGASSACPALLAVNKQINSEAREYLIPNSTATYLPESTFLFDYREVKYPATITRITVFLPMTLKLARFYGEQLPRKYQTWLSHVIGAHSEIQNLKFVLLGDRWVPGEEMQEQIVECLGPYMDDQADNRTQLELVGFGNLEYMWNEERDLVKQYESALRFRCQCSFCSM